MMSKPTRAEVQEAYQFLVFTSPWNITEFVPVAQQVEALKLYCKQHDWALDIINRASEGTE